MELYFPMAVIYSALIFSFVVVLFLIAGLAVFLCEFYSNHVSAKQRIANELSDFNENFKKFENETRRNFK